MKTENDRRKSSRGSCVNSMAWDSNNLGDHQRYKDLFSALPGTYFTEGRLRDEAIIE
jgi:hypothetical protein